jgi:hypothetical protein
VSRFRPILADLIARWIEIPPVDAEDWERKAYILSEVVEVAEELWE